MPHGYECDRCDEFVEQGRMGREMYEGQAIERVDVCPPTDDKDTFALNQYTLCDKCRRELVAWVENIPVGFMKLADKDVDTDKLKREIKKISEQMKKESRRRARR